jgi:hypothetical protein
MKTVLSIRVSKDTRSRLDREARRLGVSSSELARRAVDRLLLDIGAPELGSMYDRVAEHVGVWRSGVGDLGRESERHLREKFRKKARKRR